MLRLRQPTVSGTPAEPRAESAVIRASDIGRSFEEKIALSDVSLSADRGEVHAVLGPNGAGKTTLLRILSGLLEPSVGEVRVLGLKPSDAPRNLRRQIGLVPSGDRSFYLRLSGVENLVFFGRLHGMSRREAVRRARTVLEDVGLTDAGAKRVGLYSHGMQKRLSIARGLLSEPSVLVVDEATHDLDPAGGRQVRDLVRAGALRGVSVVWATQRLDEIRGFADRVTVLNAGTVCFVGTVPELMSHSRSPDYVLRLRNGKARGRDLQPALETALAGLASVSWSSGLSDDFVLSLASDVALGDALRSLLDNGIQVLACREERSELEEAFLSLTGGPA
jgi:ABC-2 type transport system ATP-binding protein